MLDLSELYPGTPRPASSLGRLDDNNDEEDLGQRVTIQQEHVYSTDPLDAPPKRSVPVHRPTATRPPHTVQFQSKQVFNGVKLL